MTKVVYLICSHNNPEQVIRLATVLRHGSPSSQVVLHHDQTASHLDPARLAGLDRVHLLEDDQHTVGGTFPYLQMILRCTAWVLERLEFDWLVLLSGQDYPIHPIAEIEGFLAGTGHDGFVEGFPVLDPCPWPPGEGRRRYYYRYYRVPLPARVAPAPRSAPDGSVSEALRDLRNAQPLISVKRLKDRPGVQVGVRRLRTPFSDRFRCYGGSDWWTLSRSAVESVHRFVRDHPGYVRYYRRVAHPNESFIVTILLNDPELDIDRDNKRFVRFSSPGSPHPEVLTSRDLASLLASKAHFARKFDMTRDASVLDLLDERLQLVG
jgi:hypothetical protein